MEVVLFIYGLSFFTLGVLATFVKTNNSQILYAKKIWLLGAFAFFHALVEWTFLSLLLFPQFTEQIIVLKAISLVLSYLFLFEFSRSIIKAYLKTKQFKFYQLSYLYKAKFVYPITTIAFIFFVYLMPNANGLISATRYTFGFMGTLSLGIGLYFYGSSLKNVEYAKKLKYYFKIPAIAFIFYAFLALIAVFETPYFPGTIINAQWFFESFGFPVQFLRTICALTITICSIKALQIFNEESNQNLEKSLKQVKEFSSNVSHELKTPLTTMKGELEITLSKNRDIEYYKKSMQSLLDEVDSMSKIIKNMLMLAYLEKQSIKRHFKITNFNKIFFNSLDSLVPLASKKNIDIHVEQIEDISLKGDETLLEIAIFNIIENSIKHNQSHSNVYISSKNIGNYGYIYIEDDGVGVKQEQLESIFDRLFQCDTSRSQQGKKGHGLGLSITKQIIQLHNGKTVAKRSKYGGLLIEIQFPVFMK